MTKKILVNYIGKSGGGPVFALEFAKGLAENGCEVYAVVSEFVENRHNWEQCGLLQDVYYVKTNELRGKKYYAKAQIEFSLLGRRKLKKHFEGIDFDYVITTMQHLWSLDVSKLVHTKKIVWLCHDPIPHSGSKRIDSYLGNSFAKISDETVVLTKSFIPIVANRWGIDKRHIHFMPHGRQNMYNGGNIRDYKYSEESTNFLFFGYFREYKGLRILAMAYRKLNESNQHVTLTLAGSGDYDAYRDDFEDLPNVTVINRYIADEEVAQFFDGPNIVTVLPYLDATQSGVSLTAIEFGSVVIASDTGGLREQLDDGNIGIYCKPGDVDDLYEKMLYVINNQAVVLEQKKKMKDYLKEIEWKEVTNRLLQDLDNDE